MVWESHSQRRLCSLLPFLVALPLQDCVASPALLLLAVSAARLLRWLPEPLRLLVGGAQTSPAKSLRAYRPRLALVLLKVRLPAR